MRLAWQLARLGRLLRRPLVPFAFALAALIVTVVVVGVVVLDRATATLEATLVEDVQLVAFLNEDVDEARVRQAIERVRGLPGVRAVTLVDPEQAAARLREHAAQLRSGETARVELEGIESGFLPRSLEIALEPRAVTAGAAAAIAARLRAMPELADVDALDDGLARVRAFVTSARSFARVLDVVAFASALIAVLGCALVAWRREDTEVAVLLLAGATRWQARLPARLGSALGTTLGLWLGLGACYGGARFLASHAAAGDPVRAALLGATRSIGPAELACAFAAALAFAFLFGGGRARIGEGARA